MPRLLAVIAGCGILLTLTGTLRVGHALAQGAVTPASTKGAASLRATLPTVVLDADSAGVLLSPVMAVLDDPGGEMSVSQVLGDADVRRWWLPDSDAATTWWNRGMPLISDATHVTWFAVLVRNEGSDLDAFTFTSNHPALPDLQIWRVNGDGSLDTLARGGLRHARANRDLPSMRLAVSLKLDKAPALLLLRAESPTDENFLFPLSVWSAPVLQKHVWYQERVGIFLAAMLVALGIFHGLHFVTSRDRSDLYLALYLLGSTQCLAGFMVGGLYPVMPGYYSELVRPVSMSGFALSLWALLSLVPHLLDGHRISPRATKVYRFCARGYLVATVACVVLPLYLGILSVFLLILPVLLGAAPFLLTAGWRAGSKAGRYCVFGLASLGVAGLFTMRTAPGWGGDAAVGVNTLPVILGSLLMCILFSLALGERVRADREARAQAQIEAIAAQQRALRLEREAAANLQCKVDERTAELRERNGDLARVNNDLSQLFNHMHQGVLAFDASGVVVGRASQQAQEIFGREELAGCKVQDLLYADADPLDLAAEAFRWWRESIFQLGLECFQEQVALVPRQVVLGKGSDRERHLDLEFDPIAEGDQLLLVMMLVTDRTEQVHMERAAAEREEAHVQELEVMRRMVAGGGQNFVNFLNNASERLGTVRALLEDELKEVGPGDVEFLFRHVHTVRGEARGYELEALERDCHALEEQLQAWRGQPEGGSVPGPAQLLQQLDGGLTRAWRALSEARDRLVEVSPIGAAILDQRTVRQADLERLSGYVDELQGKGLELGPLLKGLVDRLRSRPLGGVLTGFADNVDRWAGGVGKRAVLEIEGRDLQVPPALVRVLPGVLTHLLRNAVDHAIEAPEERLAEGKEEYGCIDIEGYEDARGPVIVIRDDGRGIDVPALVEKARRLQVAVVPG